MPVVSAVMDREALSEIEIEEAERWECPLLVVEAVDDSGCC